MYHDVEIFMNEGGLIFDAEKKTANAYQDVAADKVVVVDAEEKANVALRDLSFCKQDLEWSKTETNEAKEKVSSLEKEKEGLNIKIGECEDSSKEKFLELGKCRSVVQRLEEKAESIAAMIDSVLDGEHNVDRVLHPRRVRRRKKNSPATDVSTTTDNDDDIEQV